MEEINLLNCLGTKLNQAFVLDNLTFKKSGNEDLLDKIILNFEEYKMVIVPVKDTDEISVEIHSGLESFNSKMMRTENVFSEFIGKKINMTWNCSNSNGYFDLFILSFHHLHPSVLVLSEGGVLKVFKNCRINNEI